MKEARQDLWNCTSPIGLPDLIRVPGEFCTGVVKCRIEYGPEILAITYMFYKKKPVRSFRLIECDTAKYPYKYCDRGQFEVLLDGKQNCDEIIIVRNGQITDTSYTNLIFWDGCSWYTPAKPLLAGTCRARLLEEKLVMPIDIRPADLDGFRGVKLINAMRVPEEEEMIPVKAIYR
jgi:4-amino-4-deoxychorismate lyase